MSNIRHINLKKIKMPKVAKPTKNYSNKIGVYEKRRRKIKKLAEKAMKLNREIQDLVNEFKQHGYNVSNDGILDRSKQRIINIKNKWFPTERDLQIMKEHASPLQYDYIKVEMNIRKNEYDRISTPNKEDINLREIRLSLKRQVKDPTKITGEQQQIISQYADAVSSLKSQQAVDLSSPTKQKEFINSFNVIRDVSIGGNSTLINDLSYTYDALNAGR